MPSGLHDSPKRTSRFRAPPEPPRFHLRPRQHAPALDAELVAGAGARAAAHSALPAIRAINRC